MSKIVKCMSKVDCGTGRVKLRGRDRSPSATSKLDDQQARDMRTHVDHDTSSSQSTSLHWLDSRGDNVSHIAFVTASS
jgi:hypothetical protein